MNDRDIAHLALDDEAESRGQIGSKEKTINVAGVIRNDNTAISGQMVQPTNGDACCGQDENCFGRECDQSLPAVQSGDQQSHEQGNKARQRKTQPAPESPKKTSDGCDPVHFMLIPY